MPAHVALRHLRFDDAGLLAKTVAEIVETGEHDGARVDGLDGVVFAPGELYLTLARWTDASLDDAVTDATTPASRSTTARSSERETDLLTTYDYLWRWDTDWFWCSRAFGVQHPVGPPAVAAALAALRRLPPARRASTSASASPTGSTGGPGGRSGSGWSRTSRCPVERLAEFLAGSTTGRHAAGVAVPGGRRPRAWPTYPLEPGRTYVNVGFWGTVHVGPEAADAPLNRAIEAKVHELGGHKSLYSEAFYDRETFDAALRRREPRGGEGAATTPTTG